MRSFRKLWNVGANAKENAKDWPTKSPTKHVGWRKIPKRKVTIAATNLPGWYGSLMKLTNPVKRDHLLLVLFTGLRRESAAQIRRDDVDVDNCKLHIPKPTGGEDRAFDVPLSDYFGGAAGAPAGRKQANARKEAGARI